jgi:hypothetical protein
MRWRGFNTEIPMPTVLYDIYGPGLYIDVPQNDLNFVGQARVALNCLRSRPLGVQLLQAIGAACAGRPRRFLPGRTGKRTVVIEKCATANAIPTEDTSEGFRFQLTQPGNGILADPAYPKTVRGQGGCKGGIARWNPSNTIPGTNIQRPSFISLAHELIHCLHFITGDCARAPTRQFDLTVDSGLAEEEARTIGLGPYDYPANSEPLCENAFRAVFGLAERTEYAPGVTLAQVVRTI